VQGWPSEIRVDKNDSTPIRIAQRECKIRGRERLALIWKRRGDHHDLDPSFQLGVMETRAKLPVLFCDETRNARIEYQLSRLRRRAEIVLTWRDQGADRFDPSCGWEADARWIDSCATDWRTKFPWVGRWCLTGRKILKGNDSVLAIGFLVRGAGALGPLECICYPSHEPVLPIRAGVLVRLAGTT
jgi:hypothetical protein